MLPGVECARRRRLHQSRGKEGGYGDSTTRRSFCLYTRNLQSTTSSSKPSLLERSVLKQKQSLIDEKLGGSAREAKRRLDEKLKASMKSEENQQQKRKSIFGGLLRQFKS
ncbi:uncharacterized protein LOC131603637 [Vicia villosa]|uniref:uncharacterized protein LOC131603637 n=1 Tax=Vicia villosa TaxID=3911 RepID=UPI00273C7E74|nr:uncharacterized protein LOC131603637 [Vicia villosa]